MSTRKDLPNPNAPNFLQRVREEIHALLGKTGSARDRALTLADAINSGVIGVGPGGSLVPGPATGETYEPDLTPPPTPTGFAVDAAISHVFIEHDAPIYPQGRGHLRTHVYGVTINPGDPLPTFDDATDVGQFSGRVWALPSNPATTWRLWIKWETIDNVLSAAPAGGTNGLEVTTGQDVGSLLEALSGQITESQLYNDLASRIDLIDGPSSLSGSVAQRVAAEANARANAVAQEATTRAQAILDEAAARGAADGNLQQQIDLLAAAGSGDFSELLAAVQEEQTARIAGDTAEATARQTLATQMRGDYTGTDPSALTTGLVYNERQARITAEGAISSNVSHLSATVSNNYNTLNAAITSEQTARANADSALSTTISGVSAVANAKNKTYYQTTAPASGMTAGDLWFDSDGNNKAYRYSGSAWVATDDTRIAANAAAITSEQTARADADSALSSQITTLASTVNGNTAAIQTEAETRATETGNLFAKYTVKVDVAGHVSGYGLASTANNGAPTSQFGVRADQFFVVPPATSSATAPTTNLYKGRVWVDTSVTPNVTRYYTGSAWSTTPQALPFVVQATPTTIDGQVVPAGVYMDAAYIRDATITNAKIGNLAVDDAKVANLSAAKLTAGSIAVGEHIASANYVAGSSGWRINGDGTAEFSGVAVRGTVFASAGQIGGITVASSAVRAGQSGFNAGSGFYLGADGRFSVGNSSGNNIHWDGANLNIKGTVNGSTFNGVWMNSGAINLQGDGSTGWGFARSLDKWWGDGNNGWIFARQGSDGGTFAEVKAGGQRIWMSSWGDCGIQFPGITMTNGGLTINQAGVINTLNLAGNAVTIPVSGRTTSQISLLSSYVTVLSISINADGQPIWAIASGSLADTSGRESSAYGIARLLIDGVVYADSGPVSGGSFAVSAMITGPGVHAIELQAAKTETSGLNSNAALRAGANLFAIGVKR